MEDISTVTLRHNVQVYGQPNARSLVLQIVKLRDLILSTSSHQECFKETTIYDGPHKYNHYSHLFIY